MKSVHLNLRFRTRLALVMFVTMTCTGAILTWNYVNHRREILNYVSGETSRLLTVSQLAQTQIPPKTSVDDALKIYQEKLQELGIKNVSVVSPEGQVKGSTNPSQVGKKIPLKMSSKSLFQRLSKKHVETKKDPVRLEGEFSELDPYPSNEQTAFTIQYPLVLGDQVIGFAVIKGESDQVTTLSRQWYRKRLAWILGTMLAALCVVLYLAFRFTKPVDQLVKGAQQVAANNLYVSLPSTGEDEIGLLAQTFNQMVEKLRENRALQERLNEAEKLSLLGRFAATVAHEVRNSLNFINLSIDQIRAKHPDGDDRPARDLQRNLAKIKDEISRLNHLVNDVLAAGRQSPPTLVPCDLKATLTGALALVGRQASNQGIQIKLDLAPDLPVFRLDSAQMKTCFLNIITNAIQAMPGGGQLRIFAATAKAHSGAEYLQLHFADTGPGIPLAEREKVFAPFYSTKATGFGLGLAIAKKIVEDHAGRVFVDNGDNPGTDLVVQLPLPQPSRPERAALAASPAA
ncbi:MAG TPA: ATP-binding protein [Terriglobia bacterium]|nr:ATP-binding protein [Terriglobia bacterium]